MSNIQEWRNSFRLVSDSSAPVCKKGQTFRGTARNASVEFGSSSTSCANLTGGTAKPGPTTQFDSELARRRKIQIRTKSNKVGNSASTDKFERTFRGYNSHVENGRDGYGGKMSVSVSLHQATSDTAATMTHSVGLYPLNVGDTVTVSGHTAPSDATNEVTAANLAMNQTFTVTQVNTTTEVELKGTGMTPTVTYSAGTIVAAVQNLAVYAQLFGHENNTVAQAGVGGDASDVIYFKPIFERFAVNVSNR
jgi:hypothetical protein